MYMKKRKGLEESYPVILEVQGISDISLQILEVLQSKQ
jgi:hypothetical protein